MTLEQAKENMTTLQKLQAQTDAELAETTTSIDDLHANTGQQLLAAALAGDSERKRAELAERFTMLEMQRTQLEAMRAALAQRIEAAGRELHQAKADALAKLADELEQDVERKESELRELCNAIADHEGTGTFWLTENGATFQARRHLEFMRAAVADMRAGNPCPHDATTGCTFDSVLS